jgi:hypothetical protein
MAVGLQQAGAFVACLLVWPIADRLGRKKTLLLSSVIFITGTIIETINNHSISVVWELAWDWVLLLSPSPYSAARWRRKSYEVKSDRFSSGSLYLVSSLLKIITRDTDE